MDNASNFGGTYSMVYSRVCSRGSAALHEIGHAMGAVQDSAPYNTDLGHCNDKQDIMC